MSDEVTRQQAEASRNHRICIDWGKDGVDCSVSAAVHGRAMTAPGQYRCDAHWLLYDARADAIARGVKPPPPLNKYASSTTRGSRDEQALHYHSIHHEFLERVARRHTKGDLHYGEYNWRKGLPWADVFNHAITHLMHWKSEIEQGRIPDDDDLAAVAVNVEFLMYGEREAAFECMAKVPPPRPKVVLSYEQE